MVVKRRIALPTHRKDLEQENAQAAEELIPATGIYGKEEPLGQDAGEPMEMDQTQRKTNQNSNNQERSIHTGPRGARG